MPSGLAVEARFVVISFLKTWVESGQLTYKFSVHENALQPDRVRATFSKPTQEAPAAAAVAHLIFHLDEHLRSVLGFTVESETHFHSVTDLRFNEAILDQVIRRKLLLKQQQLIRLSDEFSSTRVPALMKEREEEKRDHDRETLEEYLLERLQRKDPYNDGRISFQELRDVLYALEFPAISRRDREILFAFVELDRDELVDYGALISIGAEVIDTLLNVHVPSQSRDAKSSDAKSAENEADFHEVLENFHAMVKHQQFFTMDRLDRILDAYRPPPTQQSEAEGADEAKASTAEEISATISEEESEAKGEGSVDSARRSPTPAPPSELYVTRRQLRTSLESPQLLLSRAEVNLIVSLATTTPTGQIPCSQLGELLQHVQTMVFSFQSRCFSDRLAHYLQQQFTNFESSNLQGTAEYLKKRLRQKDIRAVVKDLKKLMLTPWQVSRVASLCEEKCGDADHVISYMDCVPKVAAFLVSQVDSLELQERATAVHELQHSTEDSPASLPDEEIVVQAAAEIFEAVDEKSSSMMSITDFQSSLRQLTRSLGIPLDDNTALPAITALADPMGQGRVNYNYFQQLMYPVLRYYHQEQRIGRCIAGSKRTHDFTAEKADAKQLRADEQTEK